MPREKQREIASKGGTAAHDQGKGHTWDSHSAAIAGAKGRAQAARNRAAMRRIDPALTAVQFHVQ